MPAAEILPAAGQIEFPHAPSARAAINHQGANKPPPQFPPRRLRGRQADRIIERDFLIVAGYGVVELDETGSIAAIGFVSDAGALLFRVGIGPNPASAPTGTKRPQNVLPLPARGIDTAAVFNRRFRRIEFAAATVTTHGKV